MPIYQIQRSDFPFAVDILSTFNGIPHLMRTVEAAFTTDEFVDIEPKAVFDQLSGYFANLSDGELSGVRMAVLSVMVKGAVKLIAAYATWVDVFFVHAGKGYAMTIAPLAMQPLQSLVEVDDAFSLDPKNWGKVDNTLDDPSTRIPF